MGLVEGRKGPLSDSLSFLLLQFSFFVLFCFVFHFGFRVFRFFILASCFVLDGNRGDKGLDCRYRNLGTTDSQIIGRLD